VAAAFLTHTFTHYKFRVCGWAPGQEPVLFEGTFTRVKDNSRRLGTSSPLGGELMPAPHGAPHIILHLSAVTARQQQLSMQRFYVPVILVSAPQQSHLSFPIGVDLADADARLSTALTTGLLHSSETWVVNAQTWVQTAREQANRDAHTAKRARSGARLAVITSPDLCAWCYHSRPRVPTRPCGHVVACVICNSAPGYACVLCPESPENK